MTIDEPTRRSLYDSLVRSLGDSQADTLMSLLPQYPLAELATRDDMHSLAIALRGEMALGFGKVDRQFGEVRGEMAELRGEMRGEMAELRAYLRGEMAEMRGVIGQLGGELRAEFSQQVLMLGLLLGGSILAVLGTLLTLGFTGALA